jgi:Ras family
MRPQYLVTDDERKAKCEINVITGKSSLAVQFVDGHFVESYYPTIENTFSKTIRFKGQDFTTEIVDTAGQVGHSPRRCV